MNVFQTLYEERVISEDTLHQLQMAGGLLTTRQLRELHDKVLKEHNQLAIFANILLQSEKSVEIGVAILNEYRKCRPHVINYMRSILHVPVVYTIDQIFPRLKKIHLPPTYQEKFDKMRMDLGSLFDDVAPLIEKGTRPLSKFKDYLQRCFPSLKPKLGIAKSFKIVIEIVQESVQ